MMLPDFSVLVPGFPDCKLLWFFLMQTFAEKLFARLQGCTERFEVKLMMMMAISRAVGIHRLTLLNFYPYLQRYIQPHQRDVTQLLAAAVQACHDLVPPDAVESMIRQLVNQFVHDRARPEVMAVGLNTVREICMRIPLVSLVYSFCTSLLEQFDCRIFCCT
jgi:protein SDA1